MSDPSPMTRRGERVLVLALFLGALLAFGWTSPPGVVAEGDCAEYVAAARVAGIPHAPGAPTYMLAAAALGQVVPAEHLARAMNLLSVVCGALTVALVALVVLRGARRLWPDCSALAAGGAAGFAALLLASATEFWNQALAAEVYTPSTVLLALCLERLLAGTERARVVAALAAGLSFGVHYNAAVPAALLVTASAWGARRALGWRGLAALAGAFVLGLASFLYLPLRSLADPALDFGDPETPARFWRMLTLADMPTGKALAREPGVLLAQLGAVSTLAAQQWPRWVFAWSLVGIGVLLVRQRRLGLALLSLVLLDYAGILAMANFAPVDEEVYELRFLFLPAYLALALAAGCGLLWLARLASRRRLALPVLLVAQALLFLPWPLAQARRLDKHADRLMEEYGQALLQASDEPALLFTFGDNAWMAVSYWQVARRLRTDVVVIAAGLLRHPWYRAQLRARHPELVLEEAAPGVAGIARANAARWNLYHADPRVQAVRGFQEVPTGLLMRLVPEGERVVPLVPAAPELGPRYAPLDRRETSIRADILQAYVRTALYYRAGQDLVHAEQALREGLKLSVPVPRLADFHLARAGLLAELGDLLASRGKLAEARAAWRSAQEEAPDSAPARIAAQRLAAFPEGAGASPPR